MAVEQPGARIAIAGLGGDSGKTLVSLGLLSTWRRQGRALAAFKKGPDYIDAAWLSWGAGTLARNLDSYLMGERQVRRCFAEHVADLNLIEGNRGLFDGLDASGSYSTAALARLLRTPVVLVVGVPKVTATVAALVKGCQAMRPRVPLVGVVLNRVAGARHERVCREAIETVCQIPVVGAVPRLTDDLLPGRHLGLVTPAEHPRIGAIEERLVELTTAHLDVARIEALARSAPPLAVPRRRRAARRSRSGALRVGCFRDSAFTFYYPENLEALEAAGATIVPINAVHDQALPEVDLLYIGGGFPETHAQALSHNRALREAVRRAAEEGLPVYAECGGLVYLSRTVRYQGADYPMSGVLPLDLDVGARPAGHGYCEVRVDADNPFFPVGTELRGHEFHYSRVVAGQDRVRSAYAVARGVGCFEGRDGVTYKNVLASYAHLHAGGIPAWGERLCRGALQLRSGTLSAI